MRSVGKMMGVAPFFSIADFSEQIGKPFESLCSSLENVLHFQGLVSRFASNGGQ